MKTSFLSSSKARMASMVACLSLVVAFASCSKKYDPVPEPIGDLEILAVNAVSGSTDQDLLVNGVAKITGVSYGEATVYTKVTSGNSTLGFIIPVRLLLRMLDSRQVFLLERKLVLFIIN